MADITKRGKAYQARVRRKGYQHLSKTFDTKAEAEQWAANHELQIERGQNPSVAQADEPTPGEALERYSIEFTPS